MKIGATPIITLKDHAFVTNYNKTPDCSVEVHLHDSNEIFIALSDNIRYYIEGRYYDLRPGDIIITNDREVHRPITVTPGDYERIFTLFNPKAFLPYIDDYSIFSAFSTRKEGEGNWLDGQLPQAKKIKEIMFNLLDLNEAKHPRNRVLQKAYAIEMLVILDEFYTTFHKSDSTTKNMSDQNAPDSRIDAIIAEINATFEKTFNLSALSEKYFMDRYYLCHLFKYKTGFTVFEYLQTRRILKAKELISNGTLSLAQISEAVGYEDYTNFYKTFKKLVKISPTTYKKNVSLHEFTQ